LREHGIPFANAEGFLFPETYLMKKPRQPLDREQAGIVASTMVRMFWRRTESLWTPPPLDGEQREDAANPLDPPHPEEEPEAGKKSAPGVSRPVDPSAVRHLVILASLVEKETGLPAERGLVAGVYANRLRLGMLLQCDPTVIYGIGERFAGAILRSQLDDPGNPYNTYRHPGLPPGPICSPGLSSLRAAFAPDAHGYLYFVATGLDGGHTFSKTLQEHNQAVRLYRARMRDKEPR
jgi:UPF0755 protein